MLKLFARVHPVVVVIAVALAGLAVLAVWTDPSGVRPPGQ